MAVVIDVVRVVMSYPVLHSLWLDDNKLCEDSVFAVLAGLRRYV